MSGMPVFITSIPILRSPKTCKNSKLTTSYYMLSFRITFRLRHPSCVSWNPTSKRVSWWKVAPSVWNFWRHVDGPPLTPLKHFSCNSLPAWSKARDVSRGKWKETRSSPSEYRNIEPWKPVVNKSFSFLFHQKSRRSAEDAFRSLVKTHDKYGWVTPSLSDG